MNHTQTSIAAVLLCIGCSAGAGAWAQGTTAGDGQGADRAATTLAQHRQGTDQAGAAASPQAGPVRIQAEAALRPGTAGKSAADGEASPEQAVQPSVRSTSGQVESKPSTPKSDGSALQVLGPYGC